MSPSQPDDEQHAPLLPTAAPHARGLDGPGEPPKCPPSPGTAWSTWQLKMTDKKGRVSPYLQLALGMIVVVLLWASWPFGRFGPATDCVAPDPAWPTNVGYAGPTPS